ncbi:MAG: hypothetical protein ACRCYC_00780 [Paraclostridium sp.]|uniref:hypothetical protein n=1 Tax=Paraclostridium sp. TaxID=2023273 RepID=UPI003F39A267
MSKIKKTICTIIISLSTGLLAGCTSTEPLSTEEYLNHNKASINLDSIDDFKGLDLLKEDLENKKVILTGEMHGFDKDKILNIKMVRYLQKEIDLKYYLAEMGYSNAYFINKYLKTGDEDILQQAFSHVKGTAGHNEDNYNFYKQLYEFNKDLDDDDKIKIIGIDIEHNPISSHDYIKDIINSEKSEIESINSLLESLKNYQNKGDTYEWKAAMDDLYLKVNNVIIDLQTNEKFYKNLLGKEFLGFTIVVENIKATCDAYKDEMKFDYIRENQIYKNFIILDSTIDDGKYYGQWGLGHIYQEKVTYTSFDIEFFGSKLDKDNKFKDTVMSIAYVYDKPSSKYIPGSYYVNTDIFSDYIKNKNTCMLFKLNGHKSPFENEFISPFQSGNEFDRSKVTTDYFQYMVIFKGVNQSKDVN